jgi:hypothetical protein
MTERDDVAELVRLNRKIGDVESAGAVGRLGPLLASKLAFQRANADRTIVDRRQFLASVARSSERHTAIDSVQLYGNRAIVACVVTMKSTGDRYHNLRLWVRTKLGWQVLGWANDVVTGPGPITGFATL